MECNRYLDFIWIIIWSSLKLFPVYFVSFYLFLQLLRFRYKSIKPIEKVLRRRFINNFYISSKFPSPWSPFETPVLSYRKPLVRLHWSYYDCVLNPPPLGIFFWHLNAKTSSFVELHSLKMLLNLFLMHRVGWS